MPIAMIATAINL